MSETKLPKMSSPNCEKFTLDFLDHYLQNGFGSLSKKEVDFLVLSLLFQYSDIKNKTNFDLSIMFKIPDWRIKRLRYEYALRYEPIGDEALKKQFFHLLEKAKLVIDKRQERVIFVSEDLMLKQAIQAKLKILGYFADTSFNPELLRINLDAFLALLESLYTEKERNKFETEIKKVVKDGRRIELKDIMNEYLKGMSKDAGGGTIEFIKIGVTSAIADLPTLINLVKTFFGS